MTLAVMLDRDGSRFASATGGTGARRCRFCWRAAQTKLEGPRDLEASRSNMARWDNLSGQGWFVGLITVERDGRDAAILEWP